MSDIKQTSVSAPTINKTVLMSGADYFSVVEINSYERAHIQPDVAASIAEHKSIQSALKDAGVNVVKIDAPAGCQDGVYVANWALVRGDTAVMSTLPGPRKDEEAHAERVLRDLGKRIIKTPYHFSGQGDALPLGNRLLAGSGYRSEKESHRVLADELGYEVITLHAVPALDQLGKPVINKLTGWPDGFFYDIDLAISVLRPDLIAWCPDAFDTESQEKLRNLAGVKKIEVDFNEAVEGFACNLVSTGQTVIMSQHAPKLQAAIEAHGLSVVTPSIKELAKGGGYIRCISLTLDNA